jgi:trans-aconitate 2-methyltransferase
MAVPKGRDLQFTPLCLCAFVRERRTGLFLISHEEVQLVADARAVQHEFEGEKYRQASAHQKEWGTQLIAGLDLRDTDRILDLGCGDGTLTAQLAARVPNGCVLGIDASKGMLDTARKHEATNLEFQVCDIRDLTLVEEFDVVFSNATLHWVLDHRTFLQRVHRALHPGGYLRFNFGGDGNCPAFLRVIREAMSCPEYATCFTLFEWPWYMPAVGEYEQLMRESPFAEFKVWGESADRHFRDKDAMLKWVDQPSLVPFLPRLPDHARASFRDYVAGRMIEETIRPDGTCFEAFRRINVFARRGAS